MAQNIFEDALVDTPQKKVWRLLQKKRFDACFKFQLLLSPPGHHIPPGICLFFVSWRSVTHRSTGFVFDVIAWRTYGYPEGDVIRPCYFHFHFELANVLLTTTSTAFWTSVNAVAGMFLHLSVLFYDDLVQWFWWGISISSISIGRTVAYLVYIQRVNLSLGERWHDRRLYTTVKLYRS